MNAVSINPAPKGLTRVQIDLTALAVERMNRSMDLCEIETRKDLFNNALALFNWAVEETMQGKAIASVDKTNKHIKELTMPALANVGQAAIRQRQPESELA